MNAQNIFPGTSLGDVPGLLITPDPVTSPGIPPLRQPQQLQRACQVFPVQGDGTGFANLNNMIFPAAGPHAHLDDVFRVEDWVIRPN
jgi:hypothetical protein